MTRRPDGGESSQLRPVGWDSPCKWMCLNAGLPTCRSHGCSLRTARSVRQHVTRDPAPRDLRRHDSLHFPLRDGLPSRCRISSSRCLTRPPRRAGPVPRDPQLGAAARWTGRGVPNREAPRGAEGAGGSWQLLTRAADEARAVPSATAGDLNMGERGRALGLRASSSSAMYVTLLGRSGSNGLYPAEGSVRH